MPTGASGSLREHGRLVLAMRRYWKVALAILIALYITGPQGRIRYVDDFAIYLTNPCVTIIDVGYEVTPSTTPRGGAWVHHVSGFDFDPVNDECRHGRDIGWLWGVEPKPDFIQRPPR